ncbi:MAG: hypothetical protein GXO83_10790 [Chlorobi bacterium]|nr:hypothetical protein [Chlorobiota bacterium]
MKINLYLIICGLLFIFFNISGQNIPGLYFSKSKGGFIRQKGVYLISLNESRVAYVLVLGGDLDIVTETSYSLKGDTIKIVDHGNFVVHDCKLISTINKRNKLHKANDKMIKNLFEEYEHKLNKHHFTIKRGFIEKF